MAGAFISSFQSPLPLDVSSLHHFVWTLLEVYKAYSARALRRCDLVVLLQCWPLCIMWVQVEAECCLVPLHPLHTVQGLVPFSDEVKGHSATFADHTI